MTISESVSSNGKSSTTDASSDQNKSSTSHQEQDVLLSALTRVSSASMTELEPAQNWKQSLEQLFHLQRCSRVLMAVIEPQTLMLRYANESFCQIAGVDTPLLGSEALLSKSQKSSNQVRQIKDGILTGLEISAVELFQHWDNISLEQLYRYHLLQAVLEKYDQINLQPQRLNQQSVIAILNASPTSEQRFIRFWLNSDLLQIKRLNSKLDEFAEFKLKLMPVSERDVWLAQPENLKRLAQQLNLENYQIDGVLLLEGLEITEPEKMRRLTQRLISRDLLLQSEQWERVEQKMRSLFKSQTCLILRIQGQEARLSLSLNPHQDEPLIYSLDQLNDSAFLHAVQTNQVINVPDLRQSCTTDCERYLRKQNIRSLLLIPLVIQSANLKGTQQVLGVVGLTSDRPNHFTSTDLQNGYELIPAFITAFCHSFQQQFTNLRNIHSSVEWRFLQEADRRSWGLPPETIVFESVYPLYGISDIRGSSHERNRAIQVDLLEQFRLGLAIVEALCITQKSALGEQLKIDLQEYITQLDQITVEVEVSATDYLKKHLEVYFDYFSQCDPMVQEALKIYQNACNNEHGCVYQARAQYDEMLNQITQNLQLTWNQWQEQMQKILPHYCDLELSDGMDHMIYAGKSIDSRFNFFHLRSLRYEQLRGICDCARTIFRLKSESKITLDLAHLILVQQTPIDIFHDEHTEGIFAVRGTRDIRYEIVKKRIDKGIDKDSKNRITQPGMLTIVYSTDEEWQEYEQYLRYLHREGWIDSKIEFGIVDPLPGVSGLNYARVLIHDIYSQKQLECSEESLTS